MYPMPIMRILPNEILIENNIISCIQQRISLRKLEKINIKRISYLLIAKAEPEITILLKAYKELKKLNDKETKGQLLPLLRKYIGNPI